jgi:hypothetical protein
MHIRHRDQNVDNGFLNRVDKFFLHNLASIAFLVHPMSVEVQNRTLPPLCYGHRQAPD